MIVVLALTGVRASELTALAWGRVDHTHGRLVIADSKTEAGIREIYLSPFVREELALYGASRGTPMSQCLAISYSPFAVEAVVTASTSAAD